MRAVIFTSLKQRNINEVAQEKETRPSSKDVYDSVVQSSQQRTEQNV